VTRLSLFPKYFIIPYSIRVLCRPNRKFLLVVAVYFQPDLSTATGKSVRSQRLHRLIADYLLQMKRRSMTRRKKRSWVCILQFVGFFSYSPLYSTALDDSDIQILKTYVCRFVFVLQTCLRAFSGSRSICCQIEGCGKGHQGYSEADK
jgi:hypothetical protein